MSNVRSMTGYANVSVETAAGKLSIELRSVNSRYLDLQFRIPEELRAFEPMLRETVMQQVSRGKMECRISLAREKKPGLTYALNKTLLNELVALQNGLLAELPTARPFSVSELLRWPGIIEEASLEQGALQEQVIEAMSSVLHAFVASRDREGSALQTNLLEKVDDMQAIVQRVSPLMPHILAKFQQKSVERMQEAFGQAASGSESVMASEQEIYERIRQEVYLYGIKIDVSEELSRMAIHLDEIKSVLKNSGPVGKRLDFMLQELNREANTLGAKSPAMEMVDASISLKLLIEQMREQVQNLE